MFVGDVEEVLKNFFSVGGEGRDVWSRAQRKNRPIGQGCSHEAHYQMDGDDKNLPSEKSSFWWVCVILSKIGR